MAVELPPGLDVGQTSTTIIWMLLGALSVMSGVVTILYRASQNTNAERIEEMRAFAKIVTDNTIAHREAALATQALSGNLKDLIAMVAAFATTQQKIASNVDHHHETNVDKLEMNTKAVTALSEALRAISSAIGVRGMVQ